MFLNVDGLPRVYIHTCRVSRGCVRVNPAQGVPKLWPGCAQGVARVCPGCTWGEPRVVSRSAKGKPRVCPG